MHMLTPHIIHAVFVGGSSKVSHPVQWRIGMIGAKQIMQNSPANLNVSDARFALLSSRSMRFKGWVQCSRTHPNSSCESARSSSPTFTFMYTT